MHKGNLNLRKPYYSATLSRIESIYGNCILSKLLPGSNPLPRLKLITGNLDLRDSGVLSLFKIEKVEGNIYINKRTELEDFGELNMVEGDVLIDNNPRLEAMFNNNFKKENSKYIKIDNTSSMSI